MCLLFVKNQYWIVDTKQFVSQIIWIENGQIQAIKENDLDKDGKLDYNEFLKSHEKKWT